jgi:hypothetical protein
MKSYSLSVDGTATKMPSLTGGPGAEEYKENRIVVTIQVPPGAAQTVCVGGTAVALSPQAGILLSAGQSYTIEGKRPGEIYLVASAAQVVGANIHYRPPL